MQLVLCTHPLLPKVEIACYTLHRNSFCHTHGCDGAPEEVCRVLQRTPPLVHVQLAGKGGEGTMDAGPSHSRPVLFACLLSGWFFSPLGMMVIGKQMYRLLLPLR